MSIAVAPTILPLHNNNRSFGVVLYELLMRSRLWHSDADSNLKEAEDYERLACWTADDARGAVSRVRDRWAQALLLRLLSPEPARRPPGMGNVLEHPFFEEDEAFEAPPLGEGERHHLFLSHFQGNAVRGRC